MPFETKFSPAGELTFTSLRALPALLMAGLMVLFFYAPQAMAEPYLPFAERLVNNPPAGVMFRPDLEDVLLGSANSYRRSKQRKPLQPVEEGKLQMAARAHALDLLQHNAMGHKSSTGYDFESRMRALTPGVMFMARMAENAARERSKGPADAAKARKLFQQWVESRPHRKALLSRDYTRVATGVVQKGDVIYAVQIFVGAEVKSNLFQSTKTPPEKDPAALY